MSGAYQAGCIENSALAAQSRSMNTSWKTLALAAMSTFCGKAAGETLDLGQKLGAAFLLHVERSDPSLGLCVTYGENGEAENEPAHIPV